MRWLVDPGTRLTPCWGRHPAATLAISVGGTTPEIAASSLLFMCLFSLPQKMPFHNQERVLEIWSSLAAAARSRIILH
jgi:hypothetical protein